MTPPISDKQICSHRHSFALDNFFRRLIHSPKKIIGPYLKSGDTAIDLGCGPGFFTIPMTELVGPSGTVIAVDLQEEMLARVRSKLANMKDQSMAAKLIFHKCDVEEIKLDEKVQADFILAYYMVHETPDRYHFLQQLRMLLKPSGSILIVEPLFHVSRKDFAETLSIAEQTGLVIIDRPKGKGGKSALLATHP